MVARGDLAPGCDPGAAVFDEGLLFRAILSDRERTRRRPKLVAKHFQRCDWQVLEFVGRDVDAVGEFPQRSKIVEGRACEMRRDLGGRAVRPGSRMWHL